MKEYDSGDYISYDSNCQSEGDEIKKISVCE